MVRAARDGRRAQSDVPYSKYCTLRLYVRTLWRITAMFCHTVLYCHVLGTVSYSVQKIAGGLLRSSLPRRHQHRGGGGYQADFILF
jgi:hypothetical protein